MRYSYVIQNGNLFVEGSFHKGSLLVLEGRIAEISLDGTIVREDAENIDASGDYVIPGLVDTHFHGANGFDFSDGTVEGLKAIADYEIENGITSLCPTTMTLPDEDILRAAECFQEYQGAKKDSPYAGFYLEGPFFHPDKVGAQNPDYLQKPNEAFLEKLVAYQEWIKVIAIAPELEGAEAFVKKHPEYVWSLGHSVADGRIAELAFLAGVKRITHLYNAMPHYEEIIEVSKQKKDVFVELICDGVHNDANRIHKVFSSYDENQIILISDSMRATGLGDGESSLGGQKVFVKGNLATLANGTKAGSVTNLFDCMCTAIHLGVPVEKVVLATTINPAKSIGIDGKVGSLTIGKRANILILDRQYKRKRVLYFVV